MPEVEMLASISGTRNGADWPRRGERLTVDELEAEHLIAGGMAQLTELESATVEPAETAATPRPRARKAS